MAEHVHFEIQIDGKTYRVDAAELTGMEIKGLATIPPDDQLFERREPSGDVPIYNDTVVAMRDGLKFYHLPGSITAGRGIARDCRPAPERD